MQAETTRFIPWPPKPLVIQQHPLSPCLVQLGRYGDIINILPVAHAMWVTSNNPTPLVVARDYASILEGLSYVEGIVFDGHFSNLDQALNWLRPRKALVSQVYARGFDCEMNTDSYCKESWQRVGWLPRWNFLPLVFDRRDFDRETRFLSLLNHSKPVIVYNSQGISSPWNYGIQFGLDLASEFKECTVLDLSIINAPRIYDLLGLFDVAIALVTIDTATMHLADASSIPTVNLAVDTKQPWQTTPKKGNCVCRAYYKEAAKNPKVVLKQLRRCLEFCEVAVNHVYQYFPVTNAETLRRQAVAEATWRHMQSQHVDWTMMPIDMGQLPRSFADSNNRTLPYINDIIESAAAKLSVNDWIFFTNSDTCLTPDVYRDLQRFAATNTPAYFHRQDFGRINAPMTRAQMQDGRFYVGKDAFWFSKRWWLEHRAEFPDMLLGGEAWDAVLSDIMIRSGGRIMTHAIYHERHASTWEQSENRYTLASQKFCLDQAKKYFKSVNVDSSLHGIQ